MPFPDTHIPREIVLATHNLGKYAEFKAACPDITWISLREYSGDIPEETGQTFLENALIKARAATTLTGKPSLADDSGLVVPALGGAPGIYSARYAGPQATDEANIIALLQNLEGIPDRRAYYVCLLVLLRHPEDPLPWIAQGIWHGEIAMTPQGTGGFGYDPIFWIPSLQKTAAMLTQEEKNTSSHRAQALLSFNCHFKNFAKLCKNF